MRDRFKANVAKSNDTVPNSAPQLTYRVALYHDLVKLLAFADDAEERRKLRDKILGRLMDGAIKDNAVFPYDIYRYKSLRSMVEKRGVNNKSK